MKLTTTLSALLLMLAFTTSYAHDHFGPGPKPADVWVVYPPENGFQTIVTPHGNRTVIYPRQYTAPMAPHTGTMQQNLQRSIDNTSNELDQWLTGQEQIMLGN